MTATVLERKRKTGDGKAMAAEPLSPEELGKMHAYWRAANYLSVGQIYLMDNPLLKEPLQLKHVKPRSAGSLGHHARPELPLRSSEPGHQGVRPEDALYFGPRARRARAGG